MNMNKKILVLFVRRGYLEIEYILPILEILKKKFTIVTYFEKRKAFRSLLKQRDVLNNWKKVCFNYHVEFIFDNFLKKLLLKILLFFDLNNTIITKKTINKIHSLSDISKKLKIEEQNIKYILSDYNTHSQKIYQILKKKKRPRVCFFPTSPQIIKAKGKVDKNSRPFLKYIDYLFINSKFEFKYWSNFIAKSKIKIIGLPLFYKLKRNKNKKYKNFQVLISYNCVEKKYQQKEIINVKKLLENLISFKVPIVIKLHPMKQDQYIFDIVKELNSKYLFFSSENLVNLFKYNIKVHICSTRTAAATYSNYFNIPTLGFKQYDHGYDPNSFQITHNLIKSIKNFKQFHTDVSLILNGNKKIQKKQKISFNNIYKIPRNIKSHILNLFDD